MLPALIFALAGGPLSAKDAMQQCQKAYDSVKTFEQDVTGRIGEMKGTAHISFARPGKLRASGASLFGLKYDLLCDGKSTWVLNGENWSQSKDPENGIATVTGISANAATVVPAMLFHTAWGRLDPALAGSAKATPVTIGGRKLIKVSPFGPTGETVWIDASTHFITRTEANIMSRNITVVFGPPKVNGAIPANRFKR